MSRRTLFALCAIVAFALLLPQPAAAGGSAQAWVKEHHVGLMKLLKQPKNAASDESVSKAVDGMLDYGTIARKSLGANWDKLTDAQRQDFQSVLTQLVRRAYQRDLRKTLGYEVTVGEASPVADGSLVKTVARNRKNAREEPIDIDYVVRDNGGSWIVTDIITDGSSLVGNYQNQFGQIIRKNGFDELMRRMRHKLADG
jgi:phospholipid transport system substrate-binding protein